MIFEGKIIDEISDDEIKYLVAHHIGEKQYLEFKARVNCQSDQGKLELLRDIASMANSGGGYLIIGIRDDGKGHAQTYELITEADLENIKKLFMIYAFNIFRRE
jgi:predicted HTH transcriptional regulator